MHAYFIRSRSLAVLLSACLSIVGCGDSVAVEAASSLPAPIIVPTPAGPGSAEPNLSTGVDGSVLMSWVEPSDSGHLLRFSVFDSSSWSPARTIARGTDWFVNWADFPSLIQLEDSTLVAHWLQRTGEGAYAYGVRIARSDDGGSTWGAPVTPHDDSESEHGFVSLYDAGEGRVGAVWLDGRRYAAGEDVMTLRHASISSDGSLSNEVEIDARVCDCCQTSVAHSDGRLVVFYRDRSEQELRDIGIVALGDSAWTEPQSLHADGWQIEACPVNGPQADARGSHVAVAWFTAAGDNPRVNVAFSSDAGRTFSAPLRVDGRAPGGRVDLLMTGDGSAIVSWLERVDGAAEVRLRRVSPEGEMSEPLVVSRTGAERASGFPRMALVGSNVVLAWTAVDAAPADPTGAAAGTAPAVQTAVIRLEPPTRTAAQ